MLPARSRHASVRSLERYARPGVDSVALRVAGFRRDRIGDRAADPLDPAPFRFVLRRVQTRMVLRSPGPYVLRTLAGPCRAHRAHRARPPGRVAGVRVCGCAIRAVRTRGAPGRSRRCAPVPRRRPGAAAPPGLGRERTHRQDVRGALHHRPDIAPGPASRADVLPVRDEAGAAREAYAWRGVRRPGRPRI
ncbi:hypothetical protein [Streptomyces sp. NPDC048142]|uniref:hypothetical protein n=1 Tax=Streptomyces sp. NPDC048142 TaxID=3365501 RepID=UPI003720CC53